MEHLLFKLEVIIDVSAFRKLLPIGDGKLSGEKKKKWLVVLL